MANAIPVHPHASDDPAPKPVAKRVLPKAASVAPDESLVTVSESVKKPALEQVQRKYEVDPAYFEQHLAEAASEGKVAQVVGNAVRVDN